MGEGILARFELGIGASLPLRLFGGVLVILALAGDALLLAGHLRPFLGRVAARGGGGRAGGAVVGVGGVALSPARSPRAVSVLAEEARVGVGRALGVAFL